LKRLFTWWVTLSGVVAIYQVLGSLFPDSSVMVGISCAAEIIIILYTLMQFLLLYRFWQLIQDGKAGTTPARAIGFLFIPIFNLYWFFRVYFGLDLDLNRYISRHFDNQPGVEVRKAHPLIALVYLLCAFGGGVALYSFIFSKLFTATGSSMNLDAFNTLMIQYTWPLTIYSLASMALAVLMYLDFYLTAKKILETEEKRN
jgi:hypothetical protein